MALFSFQKKNNEPHFLICISERCREIVNFLEKDLTFF